MVELPRHFKRFDREISLNTTRARRIRRAQNSVADFLATDGPLQAYVRGPPISQGSFATDTVVRPVKESIEYDVDLLLPMDFNQFPDGFFETQRHPDYILPYLAERLRTKYAARVECKNRCARINYKDDFHIDLVPGHMANGTRGLFQICDRETGSFIYTAPAAYVDWVEALDQHFEGRFVKGIKMLKRWRDVKCGMKTSPSSLHLTVLAGRGLEHYEGRGNRGFPWLSAENASMEAFLWDVSNSMRRFLETGFFGLNLQMPGSRDENLAPSWPEDHREVFKSKLDTFIRRTGEAIDTKRTDTAIRRWRSNFGPSFIANP